VTHVPAESDFQRAEIMQKMYDITGRSKIPVFSYSFHYLFWEQFVGLLSRNIINLCTVVGTLLRLIANIFSCHHHRGRIISRRFQIHFGCHHGCAYD